MALMSAMRRSFSGSLAVSPSNAAAHPKQISIGSVPNRGLKARQHPRTPRSRGLQRGKALFEGCFVERVGQAELPSGPGYRRRAGRWISGS